MDMLTATTLWKYAVAKLTWKFTYVGTIYDVFPSREIHGIDDIGVSPWMDGCMSLSKRLKHPSSGSQDTLDVGHDKDGSTLA